jgi:hypothetical protein
VARFHFRIRPLHGRIRLGYDLTAKFPTCALGMNVIGENGLVHCSRQSYDVWVRGGRKRRPSPGDEEFGDMPAYYRDDSVPGEVKDTPAAVSLLLSGTRSWGLGFGVWGLGL